MAQTNPRRSRFLKLKRMAFLLSPLLPVVLVLGTILLVVSYRILKPEAPPETGDPASFLLPYQHFEVGSNGSTVLWFLPGLKGVPAIFLCHDYGSNRLALLDLAARLREAGFNVFLISFRGHGQASHRRSTLGILEGRDLSQAIDFALAETPVDDARVGIFGVGMGAHVSMRAALGESRVRALALDSPYPSAANLLCHQVAERVGFSNRVVCALVGSLVALQLGVPPLELWREVDVEPLFAVSTFFIVGLDRPHMARWSRRLYAAAEGNKDILVLPRSRTAILLTPEVGEYDRQIVSFFSRTLYF